MNMDDQFKQLHSLSIPAKRAAYSDRTAWMMALLSAIVYMPFDEEADDALMKMAKELAQLSWGPDVDPEEIRKRLRVLAVELAAHGNGVQGKQNDVLKAALAVGGFELVGGAPIHIPKTDTQAMVLKRAATEFEPAIAVLCFRGTQQVKDWLTNLKTEPVAIKDPRGEKGYIGNMHGGFLGAYMSAKDEIDTLLNSEDVKDLPLYITGHSLGGALAVIATWYLSAKKLAACYTFGAPRVGDAGLLGWFRTPIYRVVNAADPIPFVPPTGATLTFFKHVVRTVSAIFPMIGAFDWFVGFLVRQQDFRHYGDMKYLPFVTRRPDGEYPRDFRTHPGISNWARFVRYVAIWADRINQTVPASSGGKPDAGDQDATSGARGKPDRIDLYHGIERYCLKLGAVAKNRSD